MENMFTTMHLVDRNWRTIAISHEADYNGHHWARLLRRHEPIEVLDWAEELWTAGDLPGEYVDPGKWIQLSPGDALWLAVRANRRESKRAKWNLSLYVGLDEPSMEAPGHCEIARIYRAERFRGVYGEGCKEYADSVSALYAHREHVREHGGLRLYTR